MLADFRPSSQLPLREPEHAALVVYRCATCGTEKQRRYTIAGPDPVWALSYAEMLARADLPQHRILSITVIDHREVPAHARA
jgi:hypothetical protein